MSSHTSLSLFLYALEISFPLSYLENDKIKWNLYIFIADFPEELPEIQSFYKLLALLDFIFGKKLFLD